MRPTCNQRRWASRIRPPTTSTSPSSTRRASSTSSRRRSRRWPASMPRSSSSRPIRRASCRRRASWITSSRFGCRTFRRSTRWTARAPISRRRWRRCRALTAATSSPSSCRWAARSSSRGYVDLAQMKAYRFARATRERDEADPRRHRRDRAARMHVELARSDGRFRRSSHGRAARRRRAAARRDRARPLRRVRSRSSRPGARRRRPFGSRRRGAGQRDRKMVSVARASAACRRGGPSDRARSRRPGRRPRHQNVDPSAERQGLDRANTLGNGQGRRDAVNITKRDDKVRLGGLYRCKERNKSRFPRPVPAASSRSPPRIRIHR